MRVSKWPLWGVLAVLCAAGAFASTSLQQRATDAKEAELQGVVVGFARQTLSSELADVDLSTSLSDETVASLTDTLDKGILAGDQVLRVRIFAKNGVLRYSSEKADSLDTQRLGDPDALVQAASGVATNLVESERIGRGGGDQGPAVRVLETYAPVPLGKPQKPGAVVEIAQRYRLVEDAAANPWRTLQLGAAGAALVFVLLTLVGLARSIAAKRRLASSGLVHPQGKPTREERQKASLQAQLEQSRAQLAEHDAAMTEAVDDLRKQLAAAVARAEEADTAQHDAEESVGASQERIKALTGQLQETQKRAERAEQELAARPPIPAEAEGIAAELEAALHRIEELDEQGRQAQDAAAEVERRAGEHEQRANVQEERAVKAEARAAELEAAKTRATEVEERLRASEAKLAESEERAKIHATKAAEMEQKGASADAVRAELETKVAQMTSRLHEAEASAAELGNSLEESTARSQEVESQLQEAVQGRTILEREVEMRRAEVQRLAEDARSTVAAELEGATATMKTELEERSRDVERLTAELDQARRGGGETERQLAEAAAKIQQLENAFSQSVVRHEGSDAREAEAKQQIASLQEEVLGLRKKLSNVDDRVRTAGQRADAAEARLTGTAAERGSETARLEAELEGALEKTRRAEQRATDAEQRAMSSEGHGSSLAQALEDERAKRDEARAAAIGLKERLDAANAKNTDADQRAEDAERELRSAKERVEASEARVAQLETLVAATGAAGAGSEEVHAQIQVVRASYEARIDELESRVAEATERAHQAEIELARSVEAAGGEAERRADLERRIVELERERPEVVDPDDELARLRGELGVAIERAHAAEERARILQADLLAAHRGVDPDDVRDDPEGDLEDSESLRSRLARTAARKKGKMEGKEH